MAVDIAMPRLSDSMEEGTVLQWLVAEGERVERGQPLVEVETDKASVTYEADDAGVVLALVVAEGEAAAVGATIAVVGEPGEVVAPAGVGAGAAAAPAAGAAASAAAPAAPVASAAPAAPARPRVAASPLARRVAARLGVELTDLAGSGPHGRIVRADVEAAAAAPAPAEARVGSAPPEPTPIGSAPLGDADAAHVAANGGDPTHVQELTRLQKTVARRMAESRATVPAFELRVDVDMAACVELRARLKEVADPAPSYNDMVVKAAALALREHPKANGSFRDDRFELHERVNVGVAVAAEDALVVPVVTDADTRALGDVARRTRALAAKVRDGSIAPAELAGATFTVSNLGMFGVDGFTAVVDQPQAAILAVGALAERPAVVDGAVVARPRLTLTLSCDHRILYGADGARFLARLRELLEQPLALAL